jgi:hypothetical protein
MASKTLFAEVVRTGKPAGEVILWEKTISTQILSH